VPAELNVAILILMEQSLSSLHMCLMQSCHV